MSSEPEEMTDRRALAIFYREHKENMATIASLRERLAAAERHLAGCHEFNQKLKLDIKNGGDELLHWLAAATHFEFGNVSIWKLFADARWHVWKDEYHVDTELNEEGFDTFEAAYRAAKAAGWLQPTPEAQRQAELNAEHD